MIATPSVWSSTAKPMTGIGGAVVYPAAMR